MRQVGPEQAEFRNVLTNISQGLITEADYNTLSRRFEARNIDSRFQFEDTIRIKATKSEVVAYNIQKLRSLNEPVTLIRSKNNNSIAASASSDECNGLEKEPRLARGCKVMLRQNLWVKAGLCNGSIAIVEEIVYFQTGDFSHLDILPSCVLVRFHGYRGQTLHSKTVPIVPVVRFKKRYKL